MRVRLEEIRGDRTLEEIADDLGVAISTVQRWEKGGIAIPSFRLPEIAKAYKCAVNDIFAEDGPSPPAEARKVAAIITRMPPDRRAMLVDIAERLADEK